MVKKKGRLPCFYGVSRKVPRYPRGGKTLSVFHPGNRMQNREGQEPSGTQPWSLCNPLAKAKDAFSLPAFPFTSQGQAVSCLGSHRGPWQNYQPFRGSPFLSQIQHLELLHIEFLKEESGCSYFSLSVSQFQTHRPEHSGVPRELIHCGEVILLWPRRLSYLFSSGCKEGKKNGANAHFVFTYVWSADGRIILDRRNV